MATEIFSTGDSAGNSAFAPPLARRVHHIALAAATAKTVAWPVNYDYCMFSAADDFFARVGGTAAVPTVGGGDVVDGTGSIRNPAARVRDGEAEFSLISANAQVVTIEFFKSK